MKISNRNVSSIDELAHNRMKMNHVIIHQMEMNHVIIHCRGRLNLPDNTPKGVFVDAFGRKHSAPTVDGFQQ